MKSFTQAGNRNRHEKKKACYRMTSVAGAPDSIGDCNSYKKEYGIGRQEYIELDW